jgi:hypothetical protein
VDIGSVCIAWSFKGMAVESWDRCLFREVLGVVGFMIYDCTPYPYSYFCFVSGLSRYTSTRKFCISHLSISSVYLVSGVL